MFSHLDALQPLNKFINRISSILNELTIPFIDINLPHLKILILSKLRTTIHTFEKHFSKGVKYGIVLEHLFK
jgi:uncharacterized membrane protein (DUF106 family)